jgi:hypothetical protein
VAPTVLGLLNWTYDSRFYGRDLLAPGNPAPERAFVDNYHSLGYLCEDILTVLNPLRQNEAFYCDPVSFAMSEAPLSRDLLLRDAIAYYQTAYYLFRKHQRRTASSTGDRNELPQSPPRDISGADRHPGRIRVYLPGPGGAGSLFRR